jgi:hypothetical protein
MMLRCRSCIEFDVCPAEIDSRNDQGNTNYPFEYFVSPDSAHNIAWIDQIRFLPVQCYFYYMYLKLSLQNLVPSVKQQTYLQGMVKMTPNNYICPLVGKQFGSNPPTRISVSGLFTWDLSNRLQIKHF